MKSIESQFINEFADKFSGARLERIADKTGGTHHVTFRDVLNDGTVWDILNQLGFTDFTPSERLHSRTYTNGKRIIYKGQFLHILVRNGKSRNGNHTVVQKQTAPEKFNLGGTSWSNPTDLKKHIIANFPVIDCRAQDALISLLDVLDGTTDKFINTDILENDKSYITSDFGEIIGAYWHLLAGSKVSFPSSSNETNIDYIVDDIGIAHKSTNGSSRFVLADYKDTIDNLNFNTSAYCVLRAIANRDKYGILSNATGTVMSYWKNKLGEFSEKSFGLYVNSHKYDEYILDIKASQCGRNGKYLGIPTKSREAEEIWNNGSHDPLMFTLLTLMARYYSESDTKAIGEVVCALSDDNVFDYVDYNLEKNCVTLDRKQGYTKWKLHYHGNALSAFNNWPAPVGIE